MRLVKTAPDLIELNIRQAADLMRRLSNPNRLMIACALIEGEQSVSELETKLGIKRQFCRSSLPICREAGVVQARRSSKSVFYSVADAKAGHLIAALHQIFCDDPYPDAAPFKIPVRVKAAAQAAVFAQVRRPFEK